jgi:predicted CoA-binding protein
MKFRPKVFWMQEGIYNREAAEMLRRNNVIVVWNRCIMKEHNRLFGTKPLIPMGRLK